MSYLLVSLSVPISVLIVAKKDIETIQLYDTNLKDILRKELEEHIPSSKGKLEKILSSLMENIKKSAKINEKIIKIDADSYWNGKKELFFFEDVEVLLTNKEKIVLSLLFHNIRRTVNYSTISYALWGDTIDENRDRIKTIVKRLRKKLPKELIQNISSFGYKITV